MILTEACSLRLGGRPLPGWRILLYHAVGTRLPHEGICIAPETFRRHMEALRADPWVRIVPLADPERPGEGTAVSITFDDGYRDNLLCAAPILSGLGIPFVVFVVPAYILSRRKEYLTLPELKELASVPGCRIGSHGMNHKPLAELPPGELKRELLESRRWLEDQLGREVLAVSYPHGSASRGVREAAAEAGYALGLCSRTGVNGQDRDPLMLCRTEITSGDGSRSFRQKLYGGWDWHRFRHRDPARA